VDSPPTPPSAGPPAERAPAPAPEARSDRRTRRQYLTLLFSDLSDSTRLAAELEAEVYGELLDALREASLEVIGAHGGTVARIQGDGVLAIFGLPAAREDDARRAAAAALALHARVRGLSAAGQPCTMHSGIHSGLVLVGEGDIERGRFDVMGDAANVAARLSALAAADELLVSDESLGPEARHFDVEPRGRLPIKGRAEPLAVLCVRPASTPASAPRGRRDAAPLVGREAELDALQRALAAVAGEGAAGDTRGVACVAVAGAAGLGKTRLVEEFLRRATAAGCDVHRGFCDEGLAAEPMQPFQQMLRRAFVADAAPAGGDGVALEPALAAAGLDPTLPRPVLVRDWLVARARVRPVVAFIDDWHWADDASSHTLGAVLAAGASPATGPRPRLLVVLSTRALSASEAHLSQAQLVQLAPLADAHARATIARLVPRADPFLAEQIRRDAGGNPLHLEELCHHAANADGGRLHDGGAWLDVLIAARLARLPAARAALVQAAAVIGPVVPVWLFERLTDVAVDSPDVRALADEDFLYPADAPGTLRFKHAITRDVAYHGVGLHPRQALHARIAELLRERGGEVTPAAPPSGAAATAALPAAEGALEALAYHSQAAGRAEDAAFYAEHAGDKALAASSLDQARRQYRAALAALDRLPATRGIGLRWASIAQRLGRASVFDASRDEWPLFERAFALAEASGDTAAAARTGYWLGYIAYALGDADVAVRHGEAALARAIALADAPLAVQVRATLGQAHVAAARYDTGLALLDEAITIKRRHRSGTRTAVGFAYSLACRAHALADRGEFTAAHEAFDEAAEGVREVAHEVAASIQGLRAAVLLWQGRWAEAASTARGAHLVGEQVRSLFSFAMARAAAAYAQWMQDGRLESAQVLLDATAWLEPRQGGLFRSWNFGWIADVLATQGRRAEARLYTARALRRGRVRDWLGVPMACRAMARDAAARAPGSPEAAARALAWLARARAAGEARGSPHERAATDLAEAALRLAPGAAAADRAAALRLLDAAETAFDRMQMRWHAAEAQALRARR
jgi:class 3 adenylate cyclase/tetratricopeptide (TPR) repeat protein